MSNEEIKEEKQSSLFPDEASRNAYISRVSRKKPIGSGGKSNFPYYRETYAKAMARDIDTMIQTKEPLLYRYSKHCGPDSGISQRTLYLKINQALMFLIDNIDPTNRYSEWKSVVDIRCKVGIGILIEFKRQFREASAQTSDELTADFLAAQNPNEVEPEYIPTWRIKIDEWLESDSEKPFVLNKLALSEQQVRDIKLELASLEGIEADIKSGSIAIIRMQTELSDSIKVEKPEPLEIDGVIL